MKPVGKIYLGDCLELMQQIPAGRVDMILCDLPYGTTACKWDTIIPFPDLWAQYERIIKPNGAIILTASQPFTSALVMSNTKIFAYSWTWIKSIATGFVHAQKQPLRKTEDVLVFYKKRPLYNPQGLVLLNKIIKPSKTEIRKGNRILTQKNQIPYLREFTNYPNNVLEFASERGLHPTQKPVALFEYLIKTYTQPSEMVLDNCIGSGTTAIAAINTGRRWCGMEKDPEIFAKAQARIAHHLASIEE